MAWIIQNQSHVQLGAAAVNEDDTAVRFGCARCDLPRQSATCSVCQRHCQEVGDCIDVGHLCIACMPSKLTAHDMWDCCPELAEEQAPCIEALVPSTVSTITAIKSSKHDSAQQYPVCAAVCTA